MSRLRALRTSGRLRALVLGAVAVAAFAALPGVTPAAQAGLCGLPDAQPLWLDYAEGTVPFRKAIFAHPGVIAATSSGGVAPELRAGGAQTTYWEMKLGSYVGTTAKPADPATVVPAADRLFRRAAAASACATPLIALNELAGASTTTPWTTNNAQYRENVYQLIKELQALGARVFLLVPGAIYTGGDAAAWWQQVSGVADLVREVYLNGRTLSKLSPLEASRTARSAFRTAIGELTDLGIPPAKIGIILGLMSEPGYGGREGLQPASSWFEVVKLEALAAKQVATEVPIGTVWSWGWGTFGASGADPDKPAAACVYLWARDQSLCDGPAAAGAGFNADLAEGQIVLPPGNQCTVGPDAITTAEITALTNLTRDRDVAYAALFERLVQRRAAGDVAASDVLDAERAVILTRFRGIRRLYEEALVRASISLEQARAILADEIRRARIEATLPVAEPADAVVNEFYAANADVPVRQVESSPSAPWLGGRTRGLAISSIAPLRIFQFPTGSVEGMRTTAGRFVVRAVGAAVPLGSLPLATVRPAVRDALVAYARADALEAWNAGKEQQALGGATCLADDLPPVGSVDLTQYLLYLRLR